MAKSRKQTKRHRKHRGGLHRGGGQGSGWEPGSPLVPGSDLGLQVHKPYDACMSSARPGQMSFSMGSGLPGMKGGRYTNNLSVGNSLAGAAQIDRIPCEARITNPLNHAGGRRRSMRKSKRRSQKGGVGLQNASDMGVWEAPTARYTTAPSQWTGSTGAPVLLNQPLNPTMWSRACTQTAGRRKGKKSKKTRRSRK